MHANVKMRVTLKRSTSLLSNVLNATDRILRDRAVVVQGCVLRMMDFKASVKFSMHLEMLP